MLSTDLLLGVDPDYLIVLAQDFEAQARILRLAAAERLQTARICADATAQVQRLLQLPGVVAHFIHQGLSESAAISAASQSARAPWATVAQHWKRHKAQDRAKRARLRRLRVIELARAGKSNGAIAAAVKMHPQSVSRILSRALHQSEPVKS